MKIAQVLAEKGHNIFSIAPNEPLTAAVRQMMEQHIGALLVVEDGQLLGVLSERDILREVDLAPDALGLRQVAEAMSADPVTCHQGMEVDETMDLMLHNRSGRRVRHLPVVDEGRLLGIISIADLVAAQLEMSRFENRLLKNYIKNWPDEAAGEDGDGG